MNLAKLLLFATLGICCFAGAQAPGGDDFAEFENAPAAKPETPSLPDISDPDPLDVLEKKPEATAPPAASGKSEIVAPTPPPPMEFAQPPTESVLDEKITAEPPKLPEKVETKTEIQIPKKTAQKSKKKKTESTRIRNEDPSFRVEGRFHDIYKKYNEQPTSIESWETAVGDRRSETYRVQKGDTLWDLSQTFFGDTNFWPKIWSLNKESILNPHEVDPTMTIQFYPGTLSEAPTLGVLTHDRINEDIEPPLKIKGKVQNPGSVESLRVTSEPRGRPVGKIPNSLPLYRMGEVHSAPIEYDLPAVKTVGKSPQRLEYFIVDALPSASGRIKETELGLKSASEFQYVFVTLDDDAKKNFMVMKEKEKVGGGILIEIQGEIEVIDRVNESNLYRAIVKKSINMVEVGSFLVPGLIPRFEESSQATAASPKPVRILTGIQGDRSSLFSRQSYIFLDSGRQQGLSIGQTLPIYMNQSMRNKATHVEYLAGAIGQVKIINISDNYSTGYILNTTSMVQKGDWVGTPGVSQPRVSKLQQEPTESTHKELNTDFNDAFEKSFEDKRDQPKSDSIEDTDSGELEL